MRQALKEVSEYRGERADDAMYSCLLVDTPENCLSGRSTALLFNRAMNPGTTAYSAQRAKQTQALLKSRGFEALAKGDAYVRGQGLPSQGIAPSEADRLMADLLERASQGDPEALRTWLALHDQPQPEGQGEKPIAQGGENALQAAPPAAVPADDEPSPPPTGLTVEEAERLATEEEKQRQKWWIFQFPLDRQRITERTLEILKQSAAEPNPYKTRGEVFDAYRRGLVTHDQALRYLEAMPGQ